MVPSRGKNRLFEKALDFSDEFSTNYMPILLVESTCEAIFSWRTVPTNIEGSFAYIISGDLLAHHLVHRWGDTFSKAGK